MNTQKFEHFIFTCIVLMERGVVRGQNTGCPDGKSGVNCDISCGTCWMNEPCGESSKKCNNGCAPGFYGNICKNACDNGKYGAECSTLCGHCRNGVQCHHITGYCPNADCDPGWLGTKCNLRLLAIISWQGSELGPIRPLFPVKCCKKGLYGELCGNTCGGCLREEPCDFATGECSQGCQPGLDGELCQGACGDGFYGPNCGGICGACINQVACDKTTGVCLTGCEPGYKGQYCKTGCEYYSYGNQCTETCGNCVAGQPCDKAAGVCINGCAEGWTGDTCKTVDSG